MPTPKPDSSKLRWWHGLLFFLVACALQGVLLIGLVIAQNLNLVGQSPEAVMSSLFSPGAVVIQVLFTSVVLAGLAFGIPWRFGLEAKRWLYSNPTKARDIGWTLLGIISLGFVVDQVTFGLHALWPEVFSTVGLEQFAAVFEDASLPWFIILSLVVSAGPGLGEELFFRGLLLRGFRIRFSAWGSVALSSALFGLIHFNFLQSTGAALIGLYLGFVVVHTGSIWPAVIAHAANNLLSAGFSRYATRLQDAGDLANAWKQGHPLWLVAVAAVIFALSIRQLLRRPPPE